MQDPVGENVPFVLLLVNEIVSPSVESMAPVIFTVQALGELTDTTDGEHETLIVGVIKLPSTLPELRMVPLFSIVPELMMVPVLSITPAFTISFPLSIVPVLLKVEPARLYNSAELASSICPPSLVKIPEPSLTTVAEFT